jgi:hypothetical protein
MRVRTGFASTQSRFELASLRKLLFCAQFGLIESRKLKSTLMKQNHRRIFTRHGYDPKRLVDMAVEETMEAADVTHLQPEGIAKYLRIDHVKGEKNNMRKKHPWIDQYGTLDWARQTTEAAAQCLIRDCACAAFCTNYAGVVPSNGDDFFLEIQVGLHIACTGECNARHCGHDWRRPRYADGYANVHYDCKGCYARMRRIIAMGSNAVYERMLRYRHAAFGTRMAARFERRPLEISDWNFEFFKLLYDALFRSAAKPYGHNDDFSKWFLETHSNLLSTDEMKGILYESTEVRVLRYIQRLIYDEYFRSPTLIGKLVQIWRQETVYVDPSNWENEGHMDLINQYHTPTHRCNDAVRRLYWFNGQIDALLLLNDYSELVEDGQHVANLVRRERETDAFPLEGIPLTPWMLQLLNDIPITFPAPKTMEPEISEVLHTLCDCGHFQQALENTTVRKRGDLTKRAGK